MNRRTLNRRTLNRRTFLATATAFAGSVGGFDPARAQFNSQRPIRVIVSTSPGAAIDSYVRVISEHMAKTLGRVIVVEHKPGAGSSIAAQVVLGAPADGNAILVGTQGATEIFPSAFGDLKWSLDDFMPLIRGVVAPLVLVTHPGAGVKTLAELVTWSKGNPGKLSYSSYGPGTPSHFLGFQMTERFALDCSHVPYRGSSQQVTDLIAGHSLFGFAQIPPALQHIHAGSLTAIATTGAERSRLLPGVPSFAELGHAEFTANTWFGLMLRAGTPPAVVASLLSAATAAHADPDVKAKLEAQGFDVSGQSGAEFAADIKVQAQRWARLVKASGFRAQSKE
jgi:tripartite-type tricarboxylate transporter receptor subunit TctC